MFTIIASTILMYHRKISEDMFFICILMGVMEAILEGAFIISIVGLIYNGG